MSGVHDDLGIGRALAAGFILGAFFVLACVAWAAHWNAYTALLLSLGFIVLALTAIAALTERERRTRA